MSNPQAQGAAGGQQQTLLRPDDILKLQCLADDQKQKYRLIMQNCWTMTSSHPQGSAEWTQAMQKLREWSSQLIQKERAHRLRVKQQQQENQVQPSGSNQNSQQNQGKQPQQPQQQQPPPPQQQQQQQQQQSQSQPAAENGQSAAPAQQSQGQQLASQGQAQSQPMNAPAQIDPQIVKHIQDFPFCLPPTGPQVGTPEGEAKLKDLKNKYLNALLKQQKLAAQVRKLTQQVAERQKAGQDVPQEHLAMKQQVENEYQQMKKNLTSFREQQNQWKQEQEQRRGQQGQAAQAQPQQAQQSPPQQQQQSQQAQPQQAQPPQPQRQPSQPTIKEEPQIKVEGSQSSQSQPGSQFGNMQGNQQQPLPQQNSQGPPSSLSQQLPPRQPPTPISQQNPQPGQAPQFAQQGQPQLHQQPQRPQINPHQANAMHHTQSNSPHPQSAVSNPSGAPVPLSHQAAMSAASRSYTDPQRTTTPMQPNAQGSFHNPGSREREQLNNPKLPIPRNLNVTAPTPVNMGQARPTMSGPTNGAPGPMGQPVIPKFPPFQLEGEGDRVLSKRKLDELVRQVTGGSEEALTAEVEEAVLQLADDFVDTVISNACKLSKLRESPQLDIRDIQLVLERNYNIRIPGYASDEVRTVRKIVPAPGWVEKMKAVSAAKVMGGKTDI